MKSHRAVVLALALLAAAASAPLAAAASPPAAAPDVEIPYQTFVLDNGLTLIVHEDQKAPIVAVNVWYHVGSKNEKPGKTGFAHLFEHLMFNGSENFNDDYFKALDKLGATDTNGTTNEDRTNYFQNVPVSALDSVLWMESDRMGHLLGVVDQARLDEQRGVVQNEKRQGENRPYAVSYELITKSTWPAAHPYSWTVIGSMDDLDAASLDDVKEWFSTYYGAANATVVIAGAIDPETARAKVEKYFGDIPSGPPVARQESWVAQRTGSQRQRVEDRVPQARVYKVWNVPGWSTLDADRLQLVAGLLASGKSSRLYKRLVYDDRIATDVDATLDAREIASQFVIEATAQPGGDLAAVDRAVEEELARLLAEGPDAAEVERVRAQFFARFVRGAERIGGFGGKSDILAQSQVFADDPSHYKVVLARIAAATPAALRDTARRWLADGDYTLEVVPFPDYRTAAAGADRSHLPEPGPPPAVSFPAIERATLANGLEIVLAERHSVPLVEFDLQLDAGFAADQSASPGVGGLTMAMLDEGTRSRSALDISDQLDGLGARLNADSDLDVSSVRLVALEPNLDPSLALFADVVLNPSFPAADFERLKQQTLAAIQAEKASPFGIALRVFPPLLFGEGHAYGIPFSGRGYEDTVREIGREDLVRFHASWFKPNHARLIVVGDTTMAELRPKIEALLGDWPPGEVPVKNIAPVAPRERPAIYIVDRPGAQQSVILAGEIAPPRSVDDEVAVESATTIFGGAFTSRINMNLREDKHWSYGAGNFLPGTRAQRPYIVFAPVQTDKTRESIEEIARELREFTGSRPATAEELEKAKDQLTRTLPGSWETNRRVGGSIAEILRYDLPDDYFSTYPEKVRSLTVDDVEAAARKVMRPGGVLWVVVGDRAKIESGLRELGWGEVGLLDADGRPAAVAEPAAGADPRPAPAGR